MTTLELWKYTWKVRLFGLVRIPLIFFCAPRVVALGPAGCELVIPLSWRTRNHWGSMYFGAMSIGADCAAGLIAVWKIEQRQEKISFVFKDFKANFLKRPMTDVVFVCRDLTKIDDQIQEVITKNERVTRAIHIDAFTHDEKREHVAEFELGLSLKKKL